MSLTLPSDFHHLATTNTIPSKHDTACVRGLLQRMEQDANDLESNIRALEAQLKGVKYQVQRLDNEHDLIRPFLSPIRRVPPEILGEIFASIPADKHPLSPIRTYQSTLCTRAWSARRGKMPPSRYPDSGAISMPNSPKLDHV
ncbi:hypothetical protein FA13DRAFT_1724440 [Coprinellus micaceus]|uniref:F-box domain-containing protein n=1 Tax=Coprinellus micaceus TaxID=71717 RepID=A0A4Y7U1A4_COPMI|nr:hypothetical protein FA13DRAFT_1724440 [Coprinellus micaceus]